SAVLSSFVFDFVARQKLGGTHMTYTVLKQLPVLTMGHSSGSAPTSAGWPRWVRERAEELSGIGQDSLSYSLTRRKVLRSELDALFCILYGVGRADLEYIMESFPIVKRKDIAEYGEYRTKHLIVEIYDAMEHGIDTGTEYRTILDPPPGEGTRDDLQMAVSRSNQ